MDPSMVVMVVSSVSKNESTGSPIRSPFRVSPCSWSMKPYFSYDFANSRICCSVKGSSPFSKSQSFASGIMTGAVSRIVPSVSVFVFIIINSVKASMLFFIGFLNIHSKQFKKSISKEKKIKLNCYDNQKKDKKRRK